MIDKIKFAKAIAVGGDTPELTRFWANVGMYGEAAIFGAMPTNLNNYLHALIHNKRIKPDLDSELILCQVNNVLDCSGVQFAGTKIFMKQIERRNAAEILQALKDLKISIAV